MYTPRPQGFAPAFAIDAPPRGSHRPRLSITAFAHSLEILRVRLAIRVRRFALLSLLRARCRSLLRMCDPCTCASEISRHAAANNSGILGGSRCPAHTVEGRPAEHAQVARSSVHGGTVVVVTHPGIPTCTQPRMGLQASPVHRSPSSHSESTGTCTQPTAGVQASTVQAISSAQSSGGPPRQAPFSHRSFVVQGLPSSQEAVRFVCSH